MRNVVSVPKMLIVNWPGGGLRVPTLTVPGVESTSGPQTATGGTSAALNHVGPNTPSAATMSAQPGAAGAASIAGPSTLLSSSINVGRSYMAPGLSGLSGAGQQNAIVFLRVMHNPKEDVHVKIMIQVPAQMYFADVLDLVCRKVQEERPQEWALVAHFGDDDIVVPLNRTVESLDEACDLKLVRRDTLTVRGAVGRLTAPGGNPNTSIFAGRKKSNKENSSNALDLSAYKSWKVIRATRSARMFSKPERLLTLDGEWIWIEPADTRQFSARPTSFHISSVVACKQSAKGGAAFKLVVRRMPSLVDITLATPATGGAGRDTKRYDLEAENADDADEIVREVHKVMARRKESGNELAG